MRRVRITNLGSRITVVSIAIAIGTSVLIYVYTVAIGGAASGLGAVKGQIVLAGLIAVAVATTIGLYYAQRAASNISRLQDAARKVADGNFETKIPVASAGASLSPTLPASSSSPTRRTSCGRRSSASVVSSSCSKRRTRVPRSEPSSCGPCASRSTA